MFNWAEIGMFFAGFLAGFLYWRKEILSGIQYQKSISQLAHMQMMKSYQNGSFQRLIGAAGGIVKNQTKGAGAGE